MALCRVTTVVAALLLGARPPERGRRYNGPEVDQLLGAWRIHNRVNLSSSTASVARG